MRSELPPLALNDERVLVAALVEGRGLRAIQPLTWRDFFLPLHRSLALSVSALESLRRPVTPLSLVMAMMAEGWRQSPCGRGVLEDIQPLLEMPYVLRLGPHIEAVREASRARRLLSWLQALEDELQHGQLTVDRALRRLGEAAPPLARAVAPDGHGSRRSANAPAPRPAGSRPAAARLART